MKLEPNQLIDNRYKIIGKLGTSGTGVVWKAIDNRHADEVVLKFPLHHLDSHILERFMQEAKTMRKHSLDCPNILNIEDLGSHDDVPWYVTRYLPGGSADKLNFDQSTESAAHLNAESFDWLKQVASALDYLHKQEAFHRDVRPENILFSGEGIPYLVDFGIVKHATETHTVIAEPKAALLALAYMAPEVLKGDEFLPASEQYALAFSLYEIIAGKPPFECDNYFSLYEAIQKGPQSLSQRVPDLPTAASDVVHRGLSVDPEHRYSSCVEFATEFCRALPGSQLNRELPNIQSDASNSPVPAAVTSPAASDLSTLALDPSEEIIEAVIVDDVPPDQSSSHSIFHPPETNEKSETLSRPSNKEIFEMMSIGGGVWLVVSLFMAWMFSSPGFFLGLFLVWMAAGAVLLLLAVCRANFHKKREVPCLSKESG